MSKLRCDICGGQIEMQPDKRGVCLNCGTFYSLAAMREMFTGVKVSVTGSDEDVEQWRQLLDRYYAAGDFTEAERIVKKILEAIPNDAQASEKYEQLQVLKYMDIRNGVLKKYSGNAKVLIIPDIVTEIDAAVFAKNRYIEEVVLPKRLVSIQDELFCECSKLRKVTIPDGVEFIGAGAFYSCTSLTEVDIPASVKQIGNTDSFVNGVFIKGAFDGCSSLKMVALHSGLRILGRRAFSQTALENVELPDGLEVIGAEAFSDCCSLRRLVIPDSVVSLHEEEVYQSSHRRLRYPWAGCINLEIIEYPKRFDRLIFQGTAYFENVIMPQIDQEYEQQRLQRRNSRLCQHCGGTFAGFFTSTCKKCGKVKDY